MFEKPQDGQKEQARVDEKRQEEALSLHSKENRIMFALKRHDRRRNYEIHINESFSAK